MELKKYILPMSAANDVAHADDVAQQNNKKNNTAHTAPEAPQPETLLPEIPPIEIIRESFPRIADRIELLWGSWELEQYFTNILISDRGDREGFPVKVVSALLKIHEEHSKIAPTEDPANRYKKNDMLWKAD